MKQTLTSKGVTWQHVEAPGTEELASFVREVGLIPLDAEFVVQERHRPEISVHDGYLLVLFQVPIFQKQTRVTSGASLYVVVTANTVWTVTYEAVPALSKLWVEFEENPEKQAEYFSENPLSLALYILSTLMASAFRKLERLSKHISIAEDAVFHGNERKMVEEIAVLTRDVMDFRRVIRPQQRLFEFVPPHHLVDEEVKTQWLRLHSQMQKLQDVLESLSDSVKELGKTNTALLQHKENQLLRLLTIYSIIAIPALVMAGSFNSTQPVYQKIFWVVLGLLIVLLGIVFWQAKRKEVL